MAAGHWREQIAMQATSLEEEKLERKGLRHQGTDPPVHILHPAITWPPLWICWALNSPGAVRCVHIVSSGGPVRDCAFLIQPRKCIAAFAADKL